MSSFSLERVHGLPAITARARFESEDGYGCGVADSEAIRLRQRQTTPKPGPGLGWYPLLEAAGRPAGASSAFPAKNRKAPQPPHHRTGISDQNPTVKAPAWTHRARAAVTAAVTVCFDEGRFGRGYARPGSGTRWQGWQTGSESLTRATSLGLRQCRAAHISMQKMVTCLLQVQHVTVVELQQSCFATSQSSSNTPP
jgi:hypothetical protein